MQDNKPMHRLRQGDVGSVKTVVSALALAKTAENGYQGCIMAVSYTHLDVYKRQDSNCSCLMPEVNLDITFRLRKVLNAFLLSRFRTGNIGD